MLAKRGARQWVGLLVACQAGGDVDDDAGRDDALISSGFHEEMTSRVFRCPPCFSVKS